MPIDDEESFIEEMSRSEVGAWRDIAAGISHALHPEVSADARLAFSGPWERAGRFVLRFGAPAYADYAIYQLEAHAGQSYLVLEAAREWDPDEGAVPPLVMVEAIDEASVRTLTAHELDTLLARPLAGVIKRQIMPPQDTLPQLEEAVRARYGAIPSWGSTLGFWQESVARPLLLDGYPLAGDTKLRVTHVSKTSPPSVRLALGAPSQRPSRSRPPDPDEEPSPESLRREPHGSFSVEAIAVVGGTFVGVLAERAARGGRAAGRTADDAELSMVAITHATHWRTLSAGESVHAAPIAAAALVQGTPCTPRALREVLGLVAAGAPRATGSVTIAMRTQAPSGPMLRARVQYAGYRLAIQGDYLVRSFFVEEGNAYAVLTTDTASDEDEAPARLVCKVVDKDTLALLDDDAFRRVAVAAYTSLMRSRRIDEAALTAALGAF